MFSAMAIGTSTIVRVSNWREIDVTDPVWSFSMIA
jgi:hypothetical protein